MNEPVNALDPQLGTSEAHAPTVSPENSLETAPAVEVERGSVAPVPEFPNPSPTQTGVALVPR